ncbi:MAG: orotidine-5'-phosphate decarboxylase, partial [Verrucomicrobia bacterium]
MSPVQTNFLSTKSIPVGERLIVALDVPTNEDAIDLVETLGDAVRFYKVGLEIVMGGRWTELVEFLVNKHKDVMLDIKFFDVPETVGAAVKQAVK